MQDAHDSRDLIEDALASWIARRFPGCTLADIAWDTALVVDAVREGAADALEEAADAYESYEEQPHINHLAETVYRPGMNLSSIWLGDRAVKLRGEATP